jgi:Sec-independent protein secretion pathway component TatC
MTLGTIELYIFLFFASIAIIGIILLKKQKNKVAQLFRLLLLGIAAIFLIAGLVTPPDLISNLIIALPAIIIYSIVVAIKLR